MRVRRTLVAAVAASAVLTTVADSRLGTASTDEVRPAHPGRRRPGACCERYAADTWQSFEAMAVPTTGLPSDNVGGDLSPESRSGYTSPTNIGAYLWSTVAARDTGLIGDGRGPRADGQTLAVGRRSWSGTSRRACSTTGTTRPRSRSSHLARERQPGQAVPLQRRQRLAGHRAAAHRARRAVAGRRGRRDPQDMDFGCYYDEAEGQGNQIRGGFWDEDPHETAPVTGNYCGWARTSGTPATTTARSTPSRGWRRTSASPPARSRRSTTTARSAPSRRHLRLVLDRDQAGRGVEAVRRRRVFEGALPYRGMKIVPTWGGSMFEALMVPLFVPEETWGPRSWGRQPPALRAGPDRARHRGGAATATGASRPPTTPPAATASTAWTCSGSTAAATPPTRSGPPGTSPTRAARAGEPALRPPTTYGDGVVTPHASFLALRYAPDAALAQPGQAPRGLRRLRPRRLLRRRRGPQRAGLAALPLARPGDGHGRARQRARRRRHAWLRRRWRDAAEARAADAAGGLREPGPVGRRPAGPTSCTPTTITDPPRRSSIDHRRTHRLGEPDRDQERPRLRRRRAPRLDPARRPGRRGRRLPGDLRAGRRCPARSATRCTWPTRPTGRGEPLDHAGRDVPSVPHPPYVDTTGDAGRRAVVRRVVALRRARRGPPGPRRCRARRWPRPGPGDRDASTPRPRSRSCRDRGGR